MQSGDKSIFSLNSHMKYLNISSCLIVDQISEKSCKSPDVVLVY